MTHDFNKTMKDEKNFNVLLIPPKRWLLIHSQLAITCSKPTKVTLEQGVKYVLC